MNLDSVDLPIWFPMEERFVLSTVHLDIGDLKRDGLVGLCRAHEVLVLLIPGLHLLLIAGHEPMSGSNSFLDFGVVDLKKQTSGGLGFRELLCDAVSRSSDLDEVLLGQDFLLPLHARRLGGVFFRVSRSSSRQVLLVPLSLRVRQVVSFVAVDGQAEPTLIASQVVAHEVRIFAQVNRLKRQPSQPFPSIDIRLLPRSLAATPGLAPVLRHGGCENAVKRVGLRSEE